MIIFAYILSFIQIFSASANEVNTSVLQEPLETVSKINKGTLLYIEDTGCSNTVDKNIKLSKKEISNLYNMCAIDLCGIPEKNKTIAISNDNFPSDLSWWTMKKINRKDGLLNDIFQIGLKKKLTQLDEIKKAIKSPESISKNNTLIGEAKLAKVVFSPYVKKIYHPKAKELIDRVEIQINPPENVTPEMTEALKEYAINLKRSALINPEEFDPSNNYSDAEIVQLARDSLDKVKKSYEENPGSLPKFAEERLKFLEKIRFA